MVYIEVILYRAGKLSKMTIITPKQIRIRKWRISPLRRTWKTVSNDYNQIKK